MLNVELGRMYRLAGTVVTVIATRSGRRPAVRVLRGTRARWVPTGEFRRQACELMPLRTLAGCECPNISAPKTPFP